MDTTTTIDREAITRIAARRRFKPQTVQLAVRLFVYDVKPAQLAVEFGVNLQRVYEIKRLFLAAFQSDGLPPGWVRVTVEGPSELVQALQAELAQAIEAGDERPAAKTKTEPRPQPRLTPQADAAGAPSRAAARRPAPKAPKTATASRARARRNSDR